MRAVFLLLFVVSLLPSISHGGVLNGGGGKGVHCDTGVTDTLSVLDLYEATNIFGLKEEPRKGDLRAEMTFALIRLNEIWQKPESNPAEGFTDEAVDRLMNEIFFSKVIFIPEGSRLPVTNDASIPVLPNACKPVQVALYNNLGIQIDREYWEKLDDRNRAAIILHEALYFYRRVYGAVDSDEVRRFVGRLFSTTPPRKRFEGLPRTGYLECRAGGLGAPVYDFVVYPIEGSDHAVISFRQLDTATTLGRTVATIDLGAFETLKNPNDGLTLTSRIESDTRFENRYIWIEKSHDRLIVRTIDGATGKANAPAKGFCELR